MEAARTLLSDTRSNNESLNTMRSVDLDPSHQGFEPSDARGVARINPLNDVGCDSDSLDVGTDISSHIEQVIIVNVNVNADY